MVASCDNLRVLKEEKISLTRMFATFGKLVRIPPSTAFDALGALDTFMDVPAVALEYLDKGDLHSVRVENIMDNNGISIPNRVLWSLFLCCKPATFIPPVPLICVQL